jgi:hypothetical protein
MDVFCTVIISLLEISKGILQVPLMSGIWQQVKLKVLVLKEMRRNYHHHYVSSFYTRKLAAASPHHPLFRMISGFTLLRR